MRTPGDWAVWNDRIGYATSEPRYEAAEITKVTEKTVTTKSIYGSRENRRTAESILWSGSEEDARRLVDRLTSSVGLMKDEVRRSYERHAERTKNLITKATQP